MTYGKFPSMKEGDAKSIVGVPAPAGKTGE
jgi:hypothetical protein